MTRQFLLNVVMLCGWSSKCVWETLSNTSTWLSNCPNWHCWSQQVRYFGLIIISTSFSLCLSLFLSLSISLSPSHREDKIQPCSLSTLPTPLICLNSPSEWNLFETILHAWFLRFIHCICCELFFLYHSKARVYICGSHTVYAAKIVYVLCWASWKLLNCCCWFVHSKFRN